MPDNLRHSVKQTILKYLNVMTLKEEGLMRNWDMSPHLSSERAISGQKKLTSFWQDVSTHWDLIKSKTSFAPLLVLIFSALCLIDFLTAGSINLETANLNFSFVLFFSTIMAPLSAATLALEY